MDGALAWLSWIAEWVGRLIPAWEIVPTTHGAVKFIGGRKVKVYGPSIVWYWPARTKLETYPTARQANDLRPQTVTTTDDRTIAVGGLIVYEVADLGRLVAQTFEPDQTINDIALGAVNAVVSGKAWDEVKTAHRTGSLDRALLKRARRDLEKYGVRVLRMTLTDLAPCRVFKLMGSSVEAVRP